MLGRAFCGDTRRRVLPSPTRLREETEGKGTTAHTTMKLRNLLLSAILPVCTVLCMAATESPDKGSGDTAAPKPASVYCNRCGAKYPDAKTLLRNRCPHSFGGKGKHVLFEGEEADKYICENCGITYTSLKDLTRNSCQHGTELLPVHSPYRGGICAEYTCRWCGRKYKNLKDMTRNSCPKHPEGKGTHRPTGM